MKQAILYSLTFGFLSCILLCLFAKVITMHFLNNKVSVTVIYILAAGLPFTSFSSAVNGYFSAVRRVSKNSSRQLIEEALEIIFVIFLFKIFSPLGIENACLALILGDFIANILGFFYSYVLYKKDIKKYGFTNPSNKNFTKKIFKITVPMALTSYIRSGLSSIKQVLVPLRLQKSRYFL